MIAVEFYNSKVIELMKQREQGTIDVLNFRNELDQVFEQAKEMEKEQMIEFAKHCLDKSIDLDILMAYNQVEIEYTNQTFKSE